MLYLKTCIILASIPEHCNSQTYNSSKERIKNMTEVTYISSCCPQIKVQSEIEARTTCVGLASLSEMSLEEQLLPEENDDNSNWM